MIRSTHLRFAAALALVVIFSSEARADDGAGTMTFADKGTVVESPKKEPAAALLLVPGQRITTTAGRAGIKVHETHVTVEKGSTIRVRDGSTTPDKAVVDVTLVSGALRAGPSGGAFVVLSPTSYATIVFGKGAEAQVRVDEKGTTLVAVTKGSVEMSAWKKAMPIPAGSSSKVEKGWKPTPPNPIPGAPAWSKRPEEFSWAKDGAGQLSAEFTPAGGTAAAAFHVQIARDAEFASVVVDQKTPPETTTLAHKITEPGTYYARVAAIDADGFEGPFSENLKTTLGMLTWKSLPGHRVIGEILPPSIPCSSDGGPFEPVQKKLRFETWVPHDLRCKVTEKGDLSVIQVPKDDIAPLGLAAHWISKQHDEMRGELVANLTDKSGSALPARKLVLTSTSPDVTIVDVDPSFEAGKYFVKVRWTKSDATFRLKGKLGAEAPTTGSLEVAGPVRAADASGGDDDRFDIGLGVGPAMVSFAKPLIGGRITLEAVYWSKLGGGSFGIGLRPSVELYASGDAKVQNPPAGQTDEGEVSHKLYSASLLIGYRADGATNGVRPKVMPYIFAEPLVGLQSIEVARTALPTTSNGNGVAGVAGTVGLDFRLGASAIFAEASGRYVGSVGGGTDVVSDTGALLTLGYRLGLGAL